MDEDDRERAFLTALTTEHCTPGHRSRRPPCNAGYRVACRHEPDCHQGAV